MTRYFEELWGVEGGSLNANDRLDHVLGTRVVLTNHDSPFEVAVNEPTSRNRHLVTRRGNVKIARRRYDANTV